ncbi:MAG: hypothetical protein AMK69_26305 [Nitrospira bacterium SG8_3]|nr:MAG: hypothetical protein AMK69_26305 [Nitrospira bacterium SG8_3]
MPVSSSSKMRREGSFFYYKKHTKNGAKCQAGRFVPSPALGGVFPPFRTEIWAEGQNGERMSGWHEALSQWRRVGHHLACCRGA